MFYTLEHKFDTLEHKFETLEHKFDTLEHRFIGLRKHLLPFLYKCLLSLLIITPILVIQGINAEPLTRRNCEEGCCEVKNLN